MSRNEITGDEIKSKVNTKEYEDNYDRIFGHPELKVVLPKHPILVEWETFEEYNKTFKYPAETLDAAYERKAMMEGLVVNPLFPENKELVEQTTESKVEEWHSGKGNDKSLRECLGMTVEEYQKYVTGLVWPESEERIDIIGTNGNNGEHYEENKD